jgi:GT2 family glycosyltransferase
MNSLIYLIVLNWNNCPDTLKCLDSLAQVQEPPFRVVVVDNGSDDGSEAHIRARFPNVTLLQTGQNLGYAGGNNVGIRYALDRGADYVGIFNNDVTVAPDALARLYAALQHSVDIGIANPLLAEMQWPERVWALGCAMDWRTGDVERLYAGQPVSAWRERALLDVEMAQGAALLIRRRVFESVGLLDERFYLYFEESDWCLQVRQAGYRIVAVPSAVVWHRVSAVLGSASPVVDYYMLRNHLRFIARRTTGWARLGLIARAVGRNAATIAAYTVKSDHGQRTPHRNVRLLALRDALLGRWGKMGPDVAATCHSRR